MKSHFLQRACAYLIDAMLVTLVISLITAWMPKSNKYEEADKREQELMEKVSNNEVKLNDVYDEILEINYIKDKETIIVSLLTTVATLGYFATYAFYKDGQTLGKKLMHIKVVSEEGELTHNQMFLRTLIAQGSLSSIISMFLLMFISSKQYVSVFVVQAIQSVLLIAIVFMIIFRKDKKGLHDIVFKTQVISTK